MAGSQVHFKLVVLGESAVGKSSIVLRFVKSQYNEYQEATIGVGDPSVAVKFEIWDTAGQERYHSLAPMYYRGAQAAVVVYDITNSESFQRAKGWVSELNEKSTAVKVIALAGNKSDLYTQRAVPIVEAQQYANGSGLIFMETSAKTGANVIDLFTTIGMFYPTFFTIFMLKFGTVNFCFISSNPTFKNGYSTDRRDSTFARGATFKPYRI
ncbi:unnamed protein product [Protopolystoma xenopodis]|uniref:Ras-related protein Rab-5C n=1 Tax=Protopolystoma xenopodis TaxID=117903 RepID=A0A3S4ZK92_9PLAT|nr:unnamed protein product [Protopolystoma xenopodis]